MPIPFIVLAVLGFLGAAFYKPPVPELKPGFKPVYARQITAVAVIGEQPKEEPAK